MTKTKLSKAKATATTGSGRNNPPELIGSLRELEPISTQEHENEVAAENATLGSHVPVSFPLRAVGELDWRSGGHQSDAEFDPENFETRSNRSTVQPPIDSGNDGDRSEATARNHQSGKGKERREQSSPSPERTRVIELAGVVDELINRDRLNSPADRRRILSRMLGYADLIREAVHMEESQIKEETPSERSSVQSEPVPPIKPKVVKLFPRKEIATEVGTSSRGAQLMDRVQDTREDSKIVKWLSEHPSKRLKDYYTRPKTPPVQPASPVADPATTVPNYSGQVVLKIGADDSHRMALQIQRNEEVRQFGRTGIADQGIHWMENGRPYDIWPESRTTQVRTY